MQRFETNESRFWEIAVAGEHLQTRHGRIGTDGRPGPAKQYPSPEQARKEAKRRIAVRIRDGFRRVDDEVPDQLVEPGFVATIIQARDRAADVAEARGDGIADPAADLPDLPAERTEVEGAHLVYGDWLASHGDPRGELIALASQMRRRPEDTALVAAERALRRRVRFLPGRLEELVGELLDASARHGQASNTSTKGADARGAGRTPECRIDWQLGFVHRARIERRSLVPPYTVRELCAALFAHPSAQLLHGLAIGSLGAPDHGDYAEVVGEVGRAAPISLRELVLADIAQSGAAGHSELAATRLGDVSAVYRRLPDLRRLHLSAGSMVLGRIELASLRELAVTTFALSRDALEAIVRASFPALHTLAIRVAGSPLPLGSVESLAASPRLPRLARLRLAGSDATHDLFYSLVGEPLARRLVELDLSGGTLGDHDVDRVLADRDVFERLVRLDLSGNMFSPDGVAALARALGAMGIDLVAGDQREPVLGRPVMTEQQIYEFAPDTRSMNAARRIAVPGSFAALGSQGAVVWGRCQGHALYDVCVDTDEMAAACTCPSMKYPCKHAIALLLVTQQVAVPEHPPPEGFVGGLVLDVAPF